MAGSAAQLLRLGTPTQRSSTNGTASLLKSQNSRLGCGCRLDKAYQLRRNVLALSMQVSHWILSGWLWLLFQCPVLLHATPLRCTEWKPRLSFCEKSLPDERTQPSVDAGCGGHHLFTRAIRAHAHPCPGPGQEGFLNRGLPQRRGGCRNASFGQVFIGSRSTLCSTMLPKHDSSRCRF